MKENKAIEDCIAWAAKNGYVGANKAAKEYGSVAGRVMVEQVSAYGSYYIWNDALKMVESDLDNS